MRTNSTLDPTDKGKNGVPDHIKKAWELLGDKAVIIAVKPCTKQAVYKSWNSLSLADMDDPRLLGLILPYHNLAVSLGETSGGLCTIDCDSQAVLETMLALNPRLKGTLLTAAKRGGNLWLKVKGDYPPNTVKIPGFGEWRSTNGYTVLIGRHPDGMDYRIVQDYRPIEIKFDEIIWPQEAREHILAKFTERTDTPPTPSHSSENCNTGFLKPDRLESGNLRTVALNPEGAEPCAAEDAKTCAPAEPVDCKPVTSEDCLPAAFGSEGTISCTTKTPVSCITEKPKKTTAAQVVANLHLMHEVEARYLDWQDKNKELGKIFMQQIERFHEGEPNGRNAMIVKSVPRLYRALDEKVIVKLVMVFYDINQPYFSDSKQQHERETREMIRLVAASYQAELSPEERSVYETLHPEWRATFRICRDLAKTGNEVFGPCHFYMSFEQLRLRLGLRYTAQAERIIKRFKKAGLIQAVGTDRRKELEATTYVWLLPMAEQQKAA